MRWHDIDCANARSLQKHSEILPGTGNSGEVAFKYLVMDDLSSRAIEVLGSNLSVDPRVFIKYLHQSLNGFSIETMQQYRRGLVLVSPEPYPKGKTRPSFALQFGKARDTAEGLIHQVTCPTDIYVVPATAEHMKKKVLSQNFEELQMNRYPNEYNAHGLMSFSSLPNVLK